MSINERYKSLVKWNNRSDAAFAKEIGITRSSMSLLLNGGTKPKLETLQNTCIRFPEINVEWLLLGKGDMLLSEGQNMISEESFKDGSSIISILKNQLNEKDLQINEIQNY